MNVLIDSREQGRIEVAVSFFSKNNTVDVKELGVGDYVFTNNEGKTVGFEYKTCNDFINSVNDGRVFNQAIDQTKTFDYHFIIIEYTEELRKRLCKELFYKTKINFNKAQFYGAIARLNTYTTVLTANDTRTCFEFMEKQALKCFDNELVVKKFNKSNGSAAFRLLSNNVKGVGSGTAGKICTSLGLESVSDVFGVSKVDLLSVEGIGEKKADLILKELGNSFS